MEVGLTQEALHSDQDAEHGLLDADSARTVARTVMRPPRGSRAKLMLVAGSLALVGALMAAACAYWTRSDLKTRPADTIGLASQGPDCPKAYCSAPTCTNGWEPPKAEPVYDQDGCQTNPCAYLPCQSACPLPVCPAEKTCSDGTEAPAAPPRYGSDGCQINHCEYLDCPISFGDEQQNKYCKDSHSKQESRNAAEIACTKDSGCGGIYLPGHSLGDEWFLCSGFVLYDSYSGSIAVERLTAGSTTPPPTSKPCHIAKCDAPPACADGSPPAAAAPMYDASGCQTNLCQTLPCNVVVSWSLDIEDKYCSSTLSKHTSEDAAKAACEGDVDCGGIYSPGSSDRKEWLLCRGFTIYHSSSGSVCIEKKVTSQKPTSCSPAPRCDMPAACADGSFPALAPPAYGPDGCQTNHCQTLPCSSSSSISWGTRQTDKYCLKSYSKQVSEDAAKAACEKDDTCGGIYSPGNSKGEEWFLCPGFTLAPSRSGSFAIKKSSPLGSSGTDQTKCPAVSCPPEDTCADGSAAKAAPPVFGSDGCQTNHCEFLPCSVSWGPKIVGKYCRYSYSMQASEDAAKTACASDHECGGIYLPGNSKDTEWFLCKGFKLLVSLSGSVCAEKLAFGSSSTPEPSQPPSGPCVTTQCDAPAVCADGSYPVAAPPVYGWDGCLTNPCQTLPCSTSVSWGAALQDQFCSESYSLQVSEDAAKAACEKDEACGGIYSPGHSAGKEWFLCPGFKLFPSSSGSFAMKKPSSSGGSGTGQAKCPVALCPPEDTCADGSTAKAAPPVYGSDGCQINHCEFLPCSVFWGPKLVGKYCMQSHSKQASEEAAKAACAKDADCGGIYSHGKSNGQEWFLCPGFQIQSSTLGSIAIEKLESGSKPGCATPRCDAPPPCSDGSHPPPAPPVYGSDGCQTNHCEALSCPTSSPWGDELNHKYCTGSYSKQISEAAAKSACEKDNGCGGVYSPGNSNGKEWFLCPGFTIHDSNSGSISIQKKGSDSSPPYVAPSTWGPDLEHKYCSGSYDKQISEDAAKSACEKDNGCGGVYSPGNSNGKEWFLCPGFTIHDSNSGSVSIQKKGSSLIVPVPCSTPTCDLPLPCSDGSYPPPAPPVYGSDGCQTNHCETLPCPKVSSWGPALKNKYCSGSYSKQISEGAAKSACEKDDACGGVYSPGNSDGQEWFLCPGFSIHDSPSGSISIQKPPGASPSPILPSTGCPPMPMCDLPPACSNGQYPQEAPPKYSTHGCLTNPCEFLPCPTNGWNSLQGEHLPSCTRSHYKCPLSWRSGGSGGYHCLTHDGCRHKADGPFSKQDCPHQCVFGGSDPGPVRTSLTGLSDSLRSCTGSHYRCPASWRNGGSGGYHCLTHNGCRHRADGPFSKQDCPHQCVFGGSDPGPVRTSLTGLSDSLRSCTGSHYRCPASWRNGGSGGYHCLTHNGCRHRADGPFSKQDCPDQCVFS